jgi:hypothetical protein
MAMPFATAWHWSREELNRARARDEVKKRQEESRFEWYRKRGEANKNREAYDEKLY